MGERNRRADLMGRHVAKRRDASSKPFQTTTPPSTPPPPPPKKKITVHHTLTILAPPHTHFWQSHMALRQGWQMSLSCEYQLLKLPSLSHSTACLLVSYSSSSPLGSPQGNVIISCWRSSGGGGGGGRGGMSKKRSGLVWIGLLLFFTKFQLSSNYLCHCFASTQKIRA